MGIQFNLDKQVMKQLGIKAAVLLAELKTQKTKVIENGGFYKDGFFIMPWSEIEKETSLSKNLQKKNLDILVSAGFLESKVVLNEDTRTQVKVVDKEETLND